MRTILASLMLLTIFINGYASIVEENYVNNSMIDKNKVQIINSTNNDINEKSILAILNTNKAIVFNLDNNSNYLKKTINNLTGVTVALDVTNILVFLDNNHNLHMTLYKNLKLPLMGDNEIDQIINNDIKNIKNNSYNLKSEGNFYPIKKIYLAINEPIGEKGFINIEYEISQVRSYDGPNSKNKKYVFVTLNSGRIVTTNKIRNKLYWDEETTCGTICLYGYIISGIGPVIYTSNFDIGFQDNNKNILMEKAIPKNMNNSFSQNFSSNFGIGVTVVSPYAIPAPAPNWSWNNSFTINSNMYNISQQANNPLNVLFTWELDKGDYYLKWSNYNTTWWKCWSQKTCDKGYYDIDKVTIDAMAYNFSPNISVVYSSDINNKEKNKLFINTTIQYGDLLTYIDKNGLWGMYWYVYPAYDNVTNKKPVADFIINDTQVNTMKQFINTQTIEINWDAPVFYQYFPMNFRFAGINKCLTQNDSNKSIIIDECLSRDNINYTNQKWFFDAENKLIRSFNNPELCLSYNQQNFILDVCNERTSIKSWMSKDNDNQFHYLHYNDKYIGIIHNKVTAVDTPQNVLISMDTY